MTNKKGTKRALLGSILSLLLCMTMLIGTTFAWFTDTATSKNNVIKSGTLDVKMSYLGDNENFEYYYQYPDNKAWIDVESKDAEPIFNYDKWEPGYLDAAYLKIENKGNLAVRYNLTIVPTGEVGKLAEVIDVYYQVYYKHVSGWNKGKWNATPYKVYPAGSDLGYDKTMKYAGTLQDFIDGTVTIANDQELDPTNASFFNRPQGMVYYSIGLKMRESAGNEYQNSSVGDAFDVQLVATQSIGEKDSWSNDYDAKAEYPGTMDKEGLVANTDEATKTVKIENAAQMFAFANSVNNEGNNYKGYTVTLENNIDLANALWAPIGQTGATEFKGVFDGQGYTISNLNINNYDAGENCASGLFGWIEDHGEGIVIKNVNVDGANVYGHHDVAVIAGYIYGTIENCHVTNANVNCVSANEEANGDKCGVIAGYVGDATITNCSATDCTVSAGRDAGQLIGCATSATSNKITECKATNVTVKANGSSTGANINAAIIGRTN